MFVRILAMTFALGLSGVAYGQSDTARDRRVPRAVRPPPDSTRARDKAVDVLRSGAIYGGMDPAARRQMIDTLDAQRRIWNQRRPRVYVIRVLEVSTCIDVRTRPRSAGQLLRDQLVVRDTTIVRREPVPIPTAYEQRCPLPWRVDDLFADVARALVDTTVSVSVRYDAAYGFPRAYSVVRGGSADGGHDVLVESFASAP
jgi:uncharacterized protein DUF6174